MNSEEMEARIKVLEKQVNKLNDIEDIQRLQRSYGYYIQNWMYTELAELFADSPQAELSILTGIFEGKESIVQYFTSLKGSNADPEFLHQLMQLSGIVDVAPDGQTAQGRWFAYGGMALPVGGGVKPLHCNGIYTADYLKQDGIWKILKLIWYPIFLSIPFEGWVSKDRLQTTGISPNVATTRKPEKSRELDPRYPSGYIVPFHFKHPVTGKVTNVDKRNAALKKKK
jgi:hypothetical protein